MKLGVKPGPLKYQLETCRAHMDIVLSNNSHKLDLYIIAEDETEKLIKRIICDDMQNFRTMIKFALSVA